MMKQSRGPRPARSRAWTGSPSTVLLLGALWLNTIGAQTATAVESDPCPPSLAGTQAYAECVARGGDPATTPRTVERESAMQELFAAPAWELALSGALGAALAGGAMVAARRAGSRRSSA